MAILAALSLSLFLSPSIGPFHKVLPFEQCFALQLRASPVCS